MKASKTNSILKARGVVVESGRKWRTLGE